MIFAYQLSTVARFSQLALYYPQRADVKHAARLMVNMDLRRLWAIDHGNTMAGISTIDTPIKVTRHLLRS